VTQALSGLSGFSFFPLTPERKAICFQLQHLRAVFEHRQDKSEYLHLFNSQGAQRLKSRVLPIALPLHNRLALDKIPLDTSIHEGWQKSEPGCPLLRWLF